MKRYYLNIRTNKVHCSTDSSPCQKRIESHPENYKEFSSLEEIKQTSKKVSRCGSCMWKERDEWIEVFGDDGRIASNTTSTHIPTDTDDTDPQRSKENKIIAWVIFLVIGLISMFLFFVLLVKCDGLGWKLLMIGMLFVSGMGVLYAWAELKAISEQLDKDELTRLARQYDRSISEFYCSIGTPDMFCIDTVHGLFAGAYEVNTVRKKIVAPISHILTCSLEEKYETVNNAKSRAIVGGALAGTVGAIAGATSAKEMRRLTGYTLTIVTDLSDFGTTSYNVDRLVGLKIVQYLNR
ncbi:MAG: hypothetical protein ACLU8W_00805 [Clostridia bacterium]